MSKQCTKCKKTFDDSVMICPDCKMGLITIAGVPEPEKNEEPSPAAEAANKTISLFSVTSEESAERVVEYLNSQGIPSSYNMNLRERNYKINVAPEKSKEALKAYTAFYAIEAKRLKAEEDKRRAEEEAKKRAEEEARRRAEEEARRKAEAEERRKQEEEEKRRRLEEERKRIQAEEIKRAEAEAERVKNEAQRAREEAEAKVREAEEYKKRIQEEAKLKAEQAKAAAQAKIDALKAQAEEARLRAEEAKRAAEEELKARAEEERKRAAEEALRRKEEEERRKKEESEQRVNRFTDLFKQQSNDTQKSTRTSKGFSFDELGKTEESRFGYIPRVDGEAVSSDFKMPETSNFFEDIEPEDGPIFVETEPVEEYNIGDTIVVDAVEVEPGSEEDTEEVKKNDSGDEYSSFFSSIKQEKFNSIFGAQKEEVPKADDEQEDSGIPFFSGNEFAASSGESTFSSPLPAPEDITTPKEEKTPESIFDSFIRKEPEFSLDDDSRYTTEPIVEDIFADNPFTSKDSSKSSSSDNKVFEEVINKDLKKSGADKFKAAFDSKKNSKFGDTDNIDDIDSGIYRGFVPDYHEDDTDDEDTRIAQSMGFDPEAYKKLKAKTEKRAMERKNNPNKAKPKKEKNPDFVVVDEEEDVKLDYTGFVPDYSQKKDDMSFYTSRTEIDYSKYRKGGAQGSSDDSSNSLASLTGTLRSTNSYELNKLFSVEAVKGTSQPKDFTALKSTNFVLALTGGQLNSLFTSWLITNCTKTTAKQFEKATASNEENYDLKIEGIKALLRSNFGKLDEYALDIIVKRFYNKYIDE